MPLTRATLFTCLLTLSALAQEFRGTIQGTITDPSQAAVPSATATLKNLETGIERDTSTDATGHYLFSYVVPGSYSLTVKAPGFKTTIREGIQLSINDSLKLDVAMPVGQASDTIEVKGEVAAVQAESSSLGSVIGEKLVDAQPLKGHSSLFLYMAAAGVVGNRYLEDTRPTDTGTNVLYTANGSPPATGEVSVDGVSNTVNVGRGLYLSPWVPSTAAVGEIKMLMGTLPAEYGRAAGDDHAEAGEVHRVAVGVAQDVVPKGGYARGHGRTRVADEAAQRFRLKVAGRQDQVCAGEPGRVDKAPGVDVEHGHRRQQPVRSRDADGCQKTPGMDDRRPV